MYRVVNQNRYQNEVDEQKKGVDTGPRTRGTAHSQAFPCHDLSCVPV